MSLNSTEIIHWFGLFPSFHDSELIEIEVNSINRSAKLSYKAFIIGDEVNEQGKYKKQKECIINFVFNDVLNLKINDWAKQNIADRIFFNAIDGYEKFVVEPAFGASIEILSKSVHASVEKV